jgi:hypothetical protein
LENRKTCAEAKSNHRHGQKEVLDDHEILPGAILAVLQTASGGRLAIRRLESWGHLGVMLKV